MPVHLPNQTKIKSFYRQLGLYGFSRSTVGTYSHPEFRRFEKARCLNIHRVSHPKDPKKRTSNRPLAKVISHEHMLKKPIKRQSLSKQNEKWQRISRQGASEPELNKKIDGNLSRSQNILDDSIRALHRSYEETSVKESCSCEEKGATKDQQAEKISSWGSFQAKSSSCVLESATDPLPSNVHDQVMETIIEPIKFSMESPAKENGNGALFFEGHRFFPIDDSSAPPKGD